MGERVDDWDKGFHHSRCFYAVAMNELGYFMRWKMHCDGIEVGGERVGFEMWNEKCCNKYIEMCITSLDTEYKYYRAREMKCCRLTML